VSGEDVVAALPAAVVMTLFVGIMTGQTWAILPVAGASGVVVLVGIAAAKLRPRAVAHFHGGYDRAFVERHEGGHLKVLKAAGGSGYVKYEQSKEDGSWIGSVYEGTFSRSLEPWQYAAVAKGGEVAVGSDKGCGTDKAIFSYNINRYPGRERQHHTRKAIDFANKHAR
jgi:hypothetical protein